MSLLQWLPLCNGWAYKSESLDVEEEQKSAVAIQRSPGQEHTIIDEDGPGWILGLDVVTNSLYGTLKVDLEDGLLELEKSAYDVIYRGLNSPNVSFLWSAKYASTINQGRKTVTTAGTPERLASDVWVPSDVAVVIAALATNTGNVYLADTSARATEAANRFVLAPDKSISFKVQNLNRIWLDVDVSGQGVIFLHEQADIVNPTDPGEFCLCFTPAVPWPYRSKIKVSVKNPDFLPLGRGSGPNPDTLKILHYHINLIRVTSAKKLLESYRAISSPEIASNDVRNLLEPRLKLGR